MSLVQEVRREERLSLWDESAMSVPAGFLAPSFLKPSLKPDPDLKAKTHAAAEHNPNTRARVSQPPSEEAPGTSPGTQPPAPCWAF